MEFDCEVAEEKIFKFKTLHMLHIIKYRFLLSYNETSAQTRTFSHFLTSSWNITIKKKKIMDKIIMVFKCAWVAVMVVIVW